MEYFGNPQGSLFKLTKGEYDFIYDMIRDENPAPPAADSIEKYDKEKFLNDVYMTEAKYERSVAVLKKKKNIILQGAPGVGKTFPVMQSDIHLQRGNTVLIIDAKYYSHTTQSQFDKHTIHSNNLYQIFTYVKNRSYQFGEEKNTVSGMLL